MPSDRQRMTARRVKIETIANGDYHKREGFEPNFVLTPDGLRVSRASVIGTVVDTYINDEGSYGALTIDDGTETLRAKLFQELEPMEEVEEGDIVEIVGKVRVYDEELYIQPELVKQRQIVDELLHDLEAEKLRRKWREVVSRAKQLQDTDTDDEDIIEELAGEGVQQADAEAVLTYLSADQQFDTASSVADGSSGGRREKQDAEDEQESERRTIMRVIEDLDDGEGAGYSDIIETSGMSEEEVESVINDLLSDGTCYEPKPGKIKKL